MTRQLQEFMLNELRGWQHAVYAWVQEEENRKVRYIWDKIGNTGVCHLPIAHFTCRCCTVSSMLGKSTFMEFLEYKGMAVEIPPFNKMEDLLQVVLSTHSKQAFIIDMPRALKKDSLGEMYAGIETVKNGLAYDKRYQYKKTRFSRPQVGIVLSSQHPYMCCLLYVIVFSNTLPHFFNLSSDRWEIWRMEPDYTLVYMTVSE